MVLEISLLIVSSMCLCAALILHSLPSGILQGTILGKLFCFSHIFLFVSFFFYFYFIYLYAFVLLKVVCFLMYVNVMSSNISASLKMYADNTKVYRELSNLETNTLQFDINPLNGEVNLWINSGVYIWKMENNILLYNGTGTKVCQKCKRSWCRDLSDLSHTLTIVKLT